MASALGRGIGMAVIFTVVCIIAGIIKLIRYYIAQPERKRREELSQQSKQQAPDGKIYCIQCKNYTDSEEDKGTIFCIVCGRQRGIMA